MAAVSRSSTTSQASSLYSASPAHKLHRIAFQGEDSAHWALLLPKKTGAPIGLLVHIGVQKEEFTSRPLRHELRFQTIDLVNTTASEALIIPGAEVTESQLREAAETVFNREGNNYHMLTNNCQHFCLDVVTWLHQRYPNSISADAIKDCEAKGTKPIALRKFILWTRFTKEGREAYARAKQAKAALEAANRPASQSSNRPRMSIS